MNYSIETDTVRRLVVYTHTGVIESTDIAEVWRIILTKPEFTESDYDLLTDYRNSSFNFSLDKIDKISDFLNSLKHILSGKKQAVITDNPHNTAISVFFENETYETIGFRVKVFSSYEAAITWLVR